MAGATAEKKKAEDGGEKKNVEVKPDSIQRTALMIALPVVLAFALFYFLVLPTLAVPFSTFKSNFLGAQRVAIVVTSSNQSQFVVESGCATQTVQVVAHARNATTIDFYLLNGTTCTYPSGGLGHTLSVLTNTTSNCLNKTKSEQSLFLNYSAANYTRITTQRLYVYGNAQYWTHCPIAVDLS